MKLFYHYKELWTTTKVPRLILHNNFLTVWKCTLQLIIWPCSEIAMLQALHHLFRIFPSLVILQAFTCLALLALDRVRYRGHQSLSRAETGTCLVRGVPRLCPRPRLAASLATARTCASSPHSATRPVLFRSDSACSCWRLATAGASRHLAL